MTARMLADVQVGDALEPQAYVLRRADLIRYAGASGDFNPIHWSDRVATGVGLPGVIAHGMLTMALAGRFVTDWAGDPGSVVSFGARFIRPVLVPDDDGGATVEVSGSVTEVDTEQLTATLDVTALFDGAKVLGRTRATVRLA